MNTEKITAEVSDINEKFSYFSHSIPLMNTKDSGKLSGYIVSIKDGICVKGENSQSSSRILSGYKPLFNATSVARIKQEGGSLIGKTTQDAFGFGTFCTNVGKGFAVPKNPHDRERVCGGSSGGCAGFTAAYSEAESKHVSLAESTGGSIVCPASWCGVVGICPSYGRVSRYGLIDYANSLDKIGTMGKTVLDAALLLEVISGFDEQESTCSDTPVDEYTSFVGKSIEGKKVGVLKELFGEGVDPEVAQEVKKSIETLKSGGAEIVELSLPLTTKAALSTYYVLALSEASTNLSKLCGLRYGAASSVEGKSFNEYFKEVRTEEFIPETKRRIILGSYARMAGFRDAYYSKAAKVRTLIIEEYKKAFEQVDVLLCPTMPVIAPKFSEADQLTPAQSYAMDQLTVGPNLAGLPHITIPTGTVEGMPVGTMLIANHFDEKTLVQLGSALEVQK